MAKSVSELMSKLKKNAAGAWDKSKETAPKAKGSRIPGGLTQAVARLSSYSFKENKKGQPYFMINFVVVAPSELSGVRGNVMHTIAETKTKTVEDKLNSLSSDIQLLGGDTSGTSVDDLPKILAGLCEEKPHFYFNTWTPPATKEYPDPQTMIFIQKRADDYTPSDSDLEDPTTASDDSGDDSGDGNGDDGSAEDGSSTAGDEKPWEPSVGEVYYYKPNAKATKKEHEVTMVNKGKKTVSLKSIDKGVVFKDVAWDKLEGD